MGWEQLEQLIESEAVGNNQTDLCYSNEDHSDCCGGGTRLCHAHDDVIVKTVKIVEKVSGGFTPGPVGFTLIRDNDLFTGIEYDDGVTLSLSYNGDMLGSIADSLGNTMTMSYDDDGYLISGVVS